MNFSLPSGFTHRECLPEYTRLFQSFLRILEYLCPGQPSSVLQGACRLQNRSPVGSSHCMTLQRLDGLCVCDLRYSNLPATQYILTLWHALPIALIFNQSPQRMCGRQESPPGSLHTLNIQYHAQYSRYHFRWGLLLCRPLGNNNYH